MSFIKWEDALRKYPELGTSLRLDAAEVNSYHIPYAVAQLEGKLCNQFSVPFSSNNLTAVELAVDLLYVRLTLGKLDKAKDVQDMAMKKIDAIQSGEDGMIYVDGTYAVAVGNVYSSHSSYSPVFGMGGITEFNVSSSQLQDEEDARS